MKSPKLTFDYYNQLQLVQDPQGARQGMGDLPDQEALLKELNIRGNNPTHNYIYDAIGQLIEDRTEGLVIDWRVDGKVASISKGHHTTTTNDDVVIQFHYDGLGNRISKETLKAGEATQQTYYTRDAQGNVMAVYGEGGTTTVVKDTPAELTVGEVAHTETDVYARNHITSTTTIADKQTLNFTAGQSITLSPGFEAKQGSNATLKIGDVPATTSKEGEEVSGVFLKEHHIYGSSRLGILAHDKLIIAENPEATNEPTGKKNYELTNHLGNVLSVISDERNGNKPDVIAFNDYYPFGMLLPNRHGSSDKYRYGYQGSEKDDEIKGEGNSYTTHFRQLDPRIGRWLSPDPKEKKLPSWSPYTSMNDSPVMGNDQKGDFCINCVTAAIGAVAGGITEFAGQAIALHTEGKPILKNIDWADVAVSTIEGGVAGATFGASIPVTRTAAATARVSVDYSEKDGLKTIGGSIDGISEQKTQNKVLGDVAGELTGGALGKLTGGIAETAVKGVKGKIGKVATDAVVSTHTTGPTVGAVASRVGGAVENKLQEKSKTKKPTIPIDKRRQAASKAREKKD